LFFKRKRTEFLEGQKWTIAAVVVKKCRVGQVVKGSIGSLCSKDVQKTWTQTQQIPGYSFCAFCLFRFPFALSV